MSIFEKASRKALRFTTVRGHITTEQLWSVPVTSTDDFNLNSIATKLDNDIKVASIGGFFAPTDDKKTTADRERNELRLEIVKHVHGVITKEEEARKKRADNRRERQELAELLAKRQSEKKEAMSEEEILKRLAKIDEDSGSEG